MDPLSAFLLALVLSGALVRSAGYAGSDWAAARRGETPPSVQRMRERNRNREARGLPPTSPGPLRRVWDAAKDDAAHAMADRFARRQATRHATAGDRDDQAARKAQARWQRKQARREWVGRMLGVAGAPVADALHRLGERAAEREAWRRNRQHDHTVIADPDESATAGTDAATSTEGESAPADEVAQRRRQRQDIEQDSEPVVHSDAESPGGDPASHRVSAWPMPPELIPNWNGRDRQALRQQTVAAGDQPREEHSTEPDNTDTEEDSTMTTGQPTAASEIRTAGDAYRYGQQLRDWAVSVQQRLEQLRADATAVMECLDAEIPGLEQAQGSLAGEGLGNAAWVQELAQVQEQLTSARTAAEHVYDAQAQQDEQMAVVQRSADAVCTGAAEQMQAGEHVAAVAQRQGAAPTSTAYLTGE